MIYWRKVDAGDFKSYAPKILEYFHNIYLPNKIIDKWSNSFWNPIPLTDIKIYFPELILDTEVYGTIKEASILFLTSDTSTLHIDHTIGLNVGVEARLNIPLINTIGSITAFYTDLEKYSFNTSPGGTKSWSTHLKYELTPVTSVELTQPTILRVSAPHSVLAKNGVFPRIALTLSFHEDIVKFLI